MVHPIINQILYLPLFIVPLTTCAESNINGNIIYEDLGCIPEFGEDKTNPIKFSCKGLDLLDDKCYFRGRSYRNGETVESNLTWSTCDQACFCRMEDKSPSFTCAVVDCPEWLGVPVQHDCYRKYSLDSCCSVGAICPPFEKITKCAVDGKDYREGEKFYPKGTCLSCICEKGFAGKFEEPFCKKRLCGHQLKNYGHSIRQSCGPLYSTQWNKDGLCCPDDWICPNGSEVFEGDAKTDNQCQFGQKTLKVGQYFKKQNVSDGFGRNFKQIKCECVIPPFVKCVDN